MNLFYYFEPNRRYWSSDRFNPIRDQTVQNASIKKKIRFKRNVYGMDDNYEQAFLSNKTI